MRSLVRAERRVHELGPERRAADADDQQVEKWPRSPRTRELCTSPANFLMRASVSSISLRSSGVGARSRVAQPIVADHALLVGVGDGAAFERVHRGEGLLHRRLHLRQEFAG